MIRVLLVDDHKMVRAGLKMLLEGADDLEVVGEAENGTDAVTIAGDLLPDIVLMDLSMPGVDGVEATRRITTAGIETTVVALTSFADRERVLAVVDAGAVGYLLKDSEPEDIIQAVRAAARGESPFHPRAATSLLSGRQALDQTETKLTHRERQVLGLVAEGLANKQIARKLGIKEKTVKAHLTRVFSELDVSDRLQAALWVKEHGLTPNR